MVVVTDLQTKVEKYEARATRCQEQAQAAIDKAQQNFYEVLAGYCAPFPDKTYKAGAIVFPLLVPVTEDAPELPHMRKAAERWDGGDRIVGGPGPAPGH